MRKLFRIPVVLLLLLTACAPVPQTDSEAEPTAAAEFTETMEINAQTESSEPESEPETEASVTEQMVQYTGEPHVFDECGVLDSAETAYYNAWLDDLAVSRQICAAAVITGSLEGEKPDTFAQNYYHDLYGTESGFLVLINNDTGKDVIYREGVCSTYITDTALPVAQATPHLVEGDYAGALEILLSLGEKVPEYLFDRSGSLTQEQFQKLWETAKENPENCALLTKQTVQPEGEETPEQALAAFAEEIRSRLGAETLLVIDVQGRHCVIAGRPPELLASEVYAVWKEQGIMAAVQHYYNGLHPEETEEPTEAEETTDMEEAS